MIAGSERYQRVGEGGEQGHEARVGFQWLDGRGDQRQAEEDQPEVEDRLAEKLVVPACDAQQEADQDEYRREYRELEAYQLGRDRDADVGPDDDAEALIEKKRNCRAAEIPAGQPRQAGYTCTRYRLFPDSRVFQSAFTSRIRPMIVMTTLVHRSVIGANPVVRSMASRNES